MKYKLLNIIMRQFRFMNLDIWKEAMGLNNIYFNLVERLSEARSYRVAEQLLVASHRISNNIAKGSRSFSNKGFENLPNIARRSSFETTNVICLLFNRTLNDEEFRQKNLNSLDLLCRKITYFRKTLLKVERSGQSTSYFHESIMVLFALLFQCILIWHIVSRQALSSML